MGDEKTSRKYRQYSYSENNIEDLKEEFISLNSSELVVEVKNNNKTINYLFKRLLMTITHLSLIALFEIIFFFNIIVNFENNTFINLVNSLTNPITQQCFNYNNSEKQIITDIFNSIVNMTTINENANQAYQNRKNHNHIFLIYSWLYFVALILLSIILIIFNYLKKKKVNLKKILLDNVIMCILLGCYEYLFFKTIILNYYVINNVELTKYIFDNLSNCLLK
jgi:hypothetical protein